MPELVPVDHDPFGGANMGASEASQVRLTPVDHDPFALASTMTHWAAAPNPAAPYLNAATNFARPMWDPGARGGIIGAMQGAGYSLPDAPTAPQTVLNNPSANMALGMLSPLKALGALGKGVGAANALGEHPARVDQRLPTGAGSAAAGPQNLTVDLDAARMVPDSYNKNVDLLRDYPNMPAKLSRKAPDTVADGFVNHVSDNLKWLWNQVQPEVRDRSQLWYDGGNKIVNDWANEFGLKDSTVAGTIAAMSPQKDWFQNVSLARRALEITTDPTVPATPEMAAQFSQRPSLQKYAPLFDRINGKSLSDIDGMTDLQPAERTTLKALWVRLRDEAHNDPSYRIVTPEGAFGDTVKTKGGGNSSVAWGSLGEIGKAVDFIHADDPALPQTLLGERHKVRNFYNNLLSPNSTQGDVTIDIHAVAAGLLRPLSGNNMEVAHNFGNYAGKGLPNASGSDVTGVRGTYPFYADAYRKAAADLGVLPRQLQSVTWEAIRSLFPDTMKNAKFSSQIDGLWNQYRKGRASLDDTRSAILDAAGASNGIKPPSWFGAGRSNAALASARATSYTPELSGSGLPREAAGYTGRGGRGKPAAQSQVAPLGITAFHGSPHDFDRFDMSKIGTGEGAQAYGHGLYFAENEGTAKSYRDVLSGGTRIPGARVGRSGYQVSGVDVPQGMSGHKALDTANEIDLLMGMMHSNPDSSMIPFLHQNISRRIANWRSDSAAAVATGHDIGGSANEDMGAMADFYERHLANAAPSDVTKKPPGRMYQVSINADPEHFLDWDKPLSEQSPKVQEALGRVLKSSDRMPADWIKSSPGAEDRMREAGIPGIKYLDQGSRNVAMMKPEPHEFFNGEQGWRVNGPKGDVTFDTLDEAKDYIKQFDKGSTRNYVVFDDKLIDIMKKYGIAAIGALPAMGAYHFRTTQIDHDPFSQ